MQASLDATEAEHKAAIAAKAVEYERRYGEMKESFDELKRGFEAAKLESQARTELEQNAEQQRIIAEWQQKRNELEAQVHEIRQANTSLEERLAQQKTETQATIEGMQRKATYDIEAALRERQDAVSELEKAVSELKVALDQREKLHALVQQELKNALAKVSSLEVEAAVQVIETSSILVATQS